MKGGFWDKKLRYLTEPNLKVWFGSLNWTGCLTVTKRPTPGLGRAPRRHLFEACHLALQQDAWASPHLARVYLGKRLFKSLATTTRIRAIDLLEYKPKFPDRYIECYFLNDTYHGQTACVNAWAFQNSYTIGNKKNHPTKKTNKMTPQIDRK